MSLTSSPAGPAALREAGPLVTADPPVQGQPLVVWVPSNSASVISDRVQVLPIGLPVPPLVERPVVISLRKRVTDTEAEDESDDDPDEPEVLSVPLEIAAMAEQVMALYDMTVGAMQLMATKPDKGGAIWRIETDRGPRSLKLLHRDPARSLFSVGAQEYLARQGARVPGLVAARDGQTSVLMEGKLWIVTDWIEGLEQATKVDVAGAAALCHGLGEFHRLSRGYQPPVHAARASRLHRWPKVYEKMITKLGWFRQLARAYSEMPASATLLDLVDRFEQQAREALLRLQNSPYADLVARGESFWGIAHQDYGWSNGQQGPGGVWIIDLDGVAYDLPVRDLRKLITSTMDDKGVWDLAWMRPMIEAYHQANPIEDELYQVLLIDMALPNEFYKLVKDAVVDPATFLDADLDRALRRLQTVDATKWEALRELGLGPVPSGASSGRSESAKNGRRRR